MISLLDKGAALFVMVKVSVDWYPSVTELALTEVVNVTAASTKGGHTRDRINMLRRRTLPDAGIVFKIIMIIYMNI